MAEPAPDLTFQNDGGGSTYDPAKGAAVLEAVAQGKPARYFRKANGLPAWNTVDRWAREDDSFGDALARARVESGLAIAVDGLEIIDAVNPDHKFGSSRVSKAREQAAYRRWLASKMDPDRLGDKLAIKSEATVRLVAFADIRPKPALEAGAVDVAHTVLPAVEAPDAVQGDDT